MQPATDTTLVAEGDADERDHERPEVPEPVLERQAEHEREQGVTGLTTVEPVDAEQREPGGQRVDEPVETGGEKEDRAEKAEDRHEHGLVGEPEGADKLKGGERGAGPSIITISMCTRSSGSSPWLLAIPAGRKKAMSPGG